MSSGDSPRVIVRETVAKTILNHSSIGDYSLNCYTGCANACVYCYARFMQRFHPHDEPWGSFVDVKINAVEVLKRQLRRAEPGEVFFSSACDGWQPIEEEYRLSRRCCQLLLEYGFRVSVLTKSALVLRDMDVFAGNNATIGVTVTTLDERLRRLWEPAASSVDKRFEVIAEAKRRRLATWIMFAPLLPMLSDTSESLLAMFRRAAELEVDRVWVDAINARPRVWPAVSKLLADQFSHLREPYRRILFDRKTRETYLAELQTRIATAAKESGLGDRVGNCL